MSTAIPTILSKNVTNISRQAFRRTVRGITLAVTGGFPTARQQRDIYLMKAYIDASELIELGYGKDAVGAMLLEIAHQELCSQ